jgi:ditrans,polycis-polyprenyl diphosphate synthase
VEEYSTTARPHSTPFSQTRITQKLLSQKHERADSLASIRETSPSPSPSRSDEVEDSVSSSATLNPDSPPMRSGFASNVTVYPSAEDITADTIDSHMYTDGCPPLELFVRTSGVERLSDFMLWQCHQNTPIVFLKCFWPDFDLWHFIPVLLEWQWRQKRKERDEKPRRRVKQL